jgi:hypothetical protein
MHNGILHAAWTNLQLISSPTTRSFNRWGTLFREDLVQGGQGKIATAQHAGDRLAG